MKKRILMCILASAMICGSLVSCGKSDDSDVAPKVSSTTAAPTGETQPETTTAAENTEAETAATTTAASDSAEPTTAENTAAPANDSSDSLGHLTDAVSVLNNLSTIDSMVGGGVSITVDSSVTRTDGSNVYCKVTDPRYSSLADVKTYVTDHICGSLISRYSRLYEGEGANFKEFDGELYMLQTGLGSGFLYTGDPIISNVTDTSFTITVTFSDYGADSTLVVNAVNEGGNWKASSFSINGQAENTH